MLRQLVILLPAAFLLARVGLEAVWLAFPIAELVALVASILLYLRLYKQVICPLGQDERLAAE